MAILVSVVKIEIQYETSDQSGTYTAQRQSTQNGPVDVTLAMVGDGARGFGQRRIHQVGTDGSMSRKTKQQQQRGHQSAAANACQANNKADACACEDIEQNVHK